MANQNKFLGFVIALIAVILVPFTTACGGSIHRHAETRTYIADSNPIESTYDSASPADACEVRRRRQRATRRAEYCEAGVEAACVTRPATSVDFLASIAAVCRADLLPEDRCAELLATVPHGTEVVIPTPTTASPSALTMLSPLGLQTYRYYSDPIIWDDIEGRCAARSTGGYAVAPMGTVGGTSGGSVPITASLFGVPLVSGVGTGSAPMMSGGCSLGYSSYDVSSTLPDGMTANVTVTSINSRTGESSSSTVMVSGPMNVPVQICGHRGDSITQLSITWECVGYARIRSAGGSIGPGFSIAASSC